MNDKIRTALIGFIWFATAVDIYCCKWLIDELNPIANYIIINWGVFAFIGMKVFCTWVATEWLRHLPLFYSWIIAVGMLLLLFMLAG